MGPKSSQTRELLPQWLSSPPVFLQDFAEAWIWTYDLHFRGSNEINHRSTSPVKALNMKSWMLISHGSRQVCGRKVASPSCLSHSIHEWFHLKASPPISRVTGDANLPAKVSLCKNQSIYSNDGPCKSFVVKGLRVLSRVRLLPWDFFAFRSWKSFFWVQYS